jgi:hypothetical protein
VIGPPFGLLPMRLHENNCLSRIKAGIVHPVMRLTEPSKVVGVIVSRIVIEMRRRQARRELQAAHCATHEGKMLVQDAARRRLIAQQRDRLRGWGCGDDGVPFLAGPGCWRLVVRERERIGHDSQTSRASRRPWRVHQTYRAAQVRGDGTTLMEGGGNSGASRNAMTAASSSSSMRHSCGLPAVA